MCTRIIRGKGIILDNIQGRVEGIICFGEEAKLDSKGCAKGCLMFSAFGLEAFSTFRSISCATCCKIILSWHFMYMLFENGCIVVFLLGVAGGLVHGWDFILGWACFCRWWACAWWSCLPSFIRRSLETVAEVDRFRWETLVESRALQARVKHTHYVVVDDCENKQ
ncbi:hypothetical protein O6H91_Y568400 [Diphasiastrum complanatum]|nr:hypothetical protein O6H91_Y568400 [Diphasiastrum complanatum]